MRAPSIKPITIRANEGLQNTIDDVHFVLYLLTDDGVFYAFFLFLFLSILIANIEASLASMQTHRRGRLSLLDWFECTVILSASVEVVFFLTDEN